MSTPPHDLQTERAVLGSALINQACLDQLVGIKTSTFYSSPHAAIWEAIEHCQQSHIPIDCISVSGILRKNGQIDMIGGEAYLSELIEDSLSVSSIEWHAGRLAGLAVQRAVLSECQKTAQLILNAELGPSDTLDHHEAAISAIRGTGTSKTMSSFRETIPEMFDRMEAASKAGGADGLKSGFSELDYLTSGFHPGEYVIIAGRPGRGKSAIALSCAINCATQSNPLPVVIYSLEMSRAAVTMRAASTVSGVEVRRMRGGFVGPSERFRLGEHASSLFEAPIWVDDDSCVTVRQMMSRARAVKRKHDNRLGLVVVDYIGIIHEPGKHNGRHDETTKISQQLKRMAGELECPVIALNQLGRECETRPPNLSDLKESGSLEQDADTVIFLHWPWRIDNSKIKSDMEVIIGKQRNGPVGTVHLVWEPEFTRFSNKSDDWENENRKPGSSQE